MGESYEGKREILQVQVFPRRKAVARCTFPLFCLADTVTYRISAKIPTEEFRRNFCC